MKRFNTCIVFIFILFPGYAQTYTHEYFFDASFAIVKKGHAIMIGKGHNDSSGFKLDCFDNGNGMLLLSAHFSDESMGVLHGLFQQYHRENILQTQGFYNSNEKQGVWEEWDEYGLKTDSVVYEKGGRIKYAQYVYSSRKNNKKDFYLHTYAYTDSLSGTMYKYYYSDSGTLSAKANFIGESGIWVRYNTNPPVVDTVYTRVETEAEFPGGNREWARYLEKALGAFNPGVNGAGNGKWQVIVRFIVAEDGTISEIEPETNFGHKMEETVVRIISNGPKWVPANQFGKRVKALRRQPVTFIVEGM